MFLACKTYEKQLRIEKTRLSHQVWSHGGSTFKKKRTLKGHFSRPAETDPYVKGNASKQVTRYLGNFPGQTLCRRNWRSLANTSLRKRDTAVYNCLLLVGESTSLNDHLYKYKKLLHKYTRPTNNKANPIDYLNKS